MSDMWLKRIVWIGMMISSIMIWYFIIKLIRSLI